MDTSVAEGLSDEAAQYYDTQIVKIIPYYHTMNQLMIELVPFDADKRFKALDLGAGTGVLSSLLLQSYPNIELTIFDLSRDMLNACKKRFEEKNVSFLWGDFSKEDFGVGYDVILMGLTLHHLSDSEKHQMMRRFYSALTKGGIVLVSDIVLGSTENLTQLYEAHWRNFIRRQGIDDEKWFANYKANEPDIPTTVEKQLNWLSEAGFVDVACHFRYLNFAVFGGCKSAEW
ncbi:class I SAM-dependent methyltransferase [Candidatus Poribacteria bacterium]|nr:class I SAM-dependent methyltransferase [Candidatus Poribacteria bacterium]